MLTLIGVDRVSGGIYQNQQTMTVMILFFMEYHLLCKFVPDMTSFWMGESMHCWSGKLMLTVQTFPTRPAPNKAIKKSSQSLTICAPVDTQMFLVRIHGSVSIMRAVPITTMHWIQFQS